jgi:hypothetical protein
VFSVRFSRINGIKGTISSLGREKAYRSHTVRIVRHGFDSQLYERRLMECQSAGGSSIADTSLNWRHRGAISA